MLDFQFSGKKLLPTVIAVLVLMFALYIGVGEFMGTVNNTPLVAEPPPGGSHIVANTARMIERELDSGFCPSAVLWPGHIRDDTCGFQEGEQQILQRTVMQLSDHLTREGPTSDRDPDLNAVLANVNRPNTWSLLFSANNTASILGKAVTSLDHYNQRLQDNKAKFYPRIDNLSLLIGDVTNILGSEAKQLQEKASGTGLYSMQARKAYFHTLGTMAAACWIASVNSSRRSIKLFCSMSIYPLRTLAA